MAVEISASVGRDGKNLKSDTRKIQKLLNAVFPATPLEVDGLCGKKTVGRIERFQRRFLTNPDGRVDAGGKTLRQLNAAAPGMQRKWSGDSSKWSQDRKLKSLDGEMRARTEGVLRSLRKAGFQPKIFFAWRSVAVQRELVERGNSKVSFSFHNAQTPSGEPRAYAADVIDKRWAWDKKAMQNGFWEALGRAAKEEGLFWGGDWRSFKDWAHIQLFPNKELARVKRRSGLA